MSPETTSLNSHTLPDGWVLSASTFNWAPEIIAAHREAPDIALQIVRDRLASSIEMEAGQLWRGFPAAPDDQVDLFRHNLDEAGGVVSIVGASIDEVNARGIRRSDSQRLEFLLPQLRMAHLAGAHGIRLPIGQAGSRLWRQLEPELDALDLVLYEEIQGQQTPSHPAAGKSIEELINFDHPRVRLLVDISMFMPSLPESYLDQLSAGGVNPNLIQKLRAEWLAPETLGAVRGELQSGDVPDNVHTLYMNLLVRFGRSRAKDLLDLLPWVGAFHLKFWDLEDEDGRVSQPISDLAEQLAQVGFSGTLCSEWGGHEWLDEPATEITRGHLALARAALAEGAARA